jgi:hypothetical protein
MLDCSSETYPINDDARPFRGRACLKTWRRPTLPHFTAVPSALGGLTSLFGMGRGEHPRHSHHRCLDGVRGKGDGRRQAFDPLLR